MNASPNQRGQSNSAPPLRVGIIGCGYQGQWLARTAAELPAYQITACVDADVYAAQKAATYAPHAKVYTTAEEMLHTDNIDAVFVATPHHLLQPYALLSVQAGKHVLAEKPIAINAREAEELEAAVAHAGVTFMSGYSFRYFPEPHQAHELLCAGAVGEIEAISMGIGRSPMTGSWLVDPKAGGGPLLYLGSHIVDQLLWYVGDVPVEVYADVRYHSTTGIATTSTFQIRFARGAVAQCLVTDAANSWFYYLNLLGRTGKLQLAFATLPNYTLTVQSETLPEYNETKSFGKVVERNAAILQKLKAELSDFAEAVALARQPPITVEDGRQVLVVLDAVIESGRTGRPVRIG